jgi:hypothetical protein
MKAEIARGKTRYILRRGLLAWALPVYILYLLLTAAVQTLWKKIAYRQALAELFPYSIIIGLVAFGIAGYFVGRHHWRQLLQEAGPKYQKTSNK